MLLWAPSDWSKVLHTGISFSLSSSFFFHTIMRIFKRAVFSCCVEVNFLSKKGAPQEPKGHFFPFVFILFFLIFLRLPDSEEILKGAWRRFYVDERYHTKAFSPSFSLFSFSLPFFLSFFFSFSFILGALAKRRPAQLLLLLHPRDGPDGICKWLKFQNLQEFM